MTDLTQPPEWLRSTIITMEMHTDDRAIAWRYETVSDGPHRVKPYKVHVTTRSATKPNSFGRKVFALDGTIERDGMMHPIPR